MEVDQHESAKPKGDLRVAIDIICRAGESGVGDYSVSLARALAPFASPTLITSDRLPSVYRDMGFATKLIFRRARYYPLSLLKLLAHYAHKPPTTIIFQSWLLVPFMDGMVARALRSMGHRVFATVHDTLPHRPRPWSRLEQSWFYKAFQGLIAHSFKSRDDLRALGVTQPIEVLPHGLYEVFITEDVSTAEAREKLGLPGLPTNILLQFGHIERRKGCFDFLEAAARCRDLSSIHFVLAGRNDLGAEDSNVLDLYRELPNVTIADKHVAFEQVQYYFRASNLVVQPYLEGTTSGVYKIALAFSVPVVASEVGDLGEIIARGAAISIGAGPGQQDNLARVVREYAGNPEGLVDPVRARMDLERAETGWNEVARRYSEFVIPSNL